MMKDTADRILAQTRGTYGAASASRPVSQERRYWEELKRFVDYVREGEAVLDVGCGRGHAYELFKAKGALYAGVDLSETTVLAAREQWKGTEAAFEVGDVMDLPVEDGRFAAVMAVAVLHHVPSRAYRLQAMRELVRATRSGGYVLMANWNLWRPRYWRAHLHQRFGRVNGWDFGDLKVSWRSPDAARYYHAFTLKELERMCSEVGLDLVEKSYVKGAAPAGWMDGESLVLVARKR